MVFLESIFDKLEQVLISSLILSPNTSLLLCPPTTKGGGEGHIVFGMDPVGAGISIGVGVKLLVRLVTWIPFGIFWRYLVEQDQTTCCLQEWQLCLSYFWSYHPLFYLKKISCLLCNSTTLWNISMVLGRNVEQDQTTYQVQEWQLCLSYFWRYLPLLYLTVVIHWFRVRSVKSKTLWNIFMILGRNVEQDKMMCLIQE